MEGPRSSAASCCPVTPAARRSSTRRSSGSTSPEPTRDASARPWSRCWGRPTFPRAPSRGSSRVSRRCSRAGVSGTCPKSATRSCTWMGSTSRSVWPAGSFPSLCWPCSGSPKTARRFWSRWHWQSARPPRTGPASCRGCSAADSPHRRCWSSTGTADWARLSRAGRRFRCSAALVIMQSAGLCG